MHKTESISSKPQPEIKLFQPTYNLDVVKCTKLLDILTYQYSCPLGGFIQDIIPRRENSVTGGTLYTPLN